MYNMQEKRRSTTPSLPEEDGDIPINTNIINHMIAKIMSIDTPFFN